MSYRPQRIIPPPAGFNAEPYIYPVTQNQVNAGAALGPSASLRDIPIAMDRDFDFYLCGLAYSCPINLNQLGIRLRDAWNVYLSDDHLLTCLYAYPAGIDPARGGGFIPVFDPPILCPAGSYLQMDVTNFSKANSYVFQNIELRGFKAVPPGACA